MTLIWNIIQSVITILEIRVCVWMMEKFAEPRYSGKKQKIVVWIVTLGVGVAYAVNRWMAAYYSRTEILTMIVLMCVSTIWLFSYYRNIAGFIATNYLLVSGIVDLFVMGMVEILVENPKLFSRVQHDNDIYRIGVMVISKAFLFLGCWIIQKRINKKVIHQFNGRKIGIICVLLCSVEYIGVHILTRILNVSSYVAYTFLIGLMLYMIVIFLMISVMGVILLYYDKKEELKLKSIFLESLNCENQRMIKLYREREVMYHDFKNHLLALDGYMQNGDFEQLQSYMERIREPFLQKPIQWRTGHNIADLILNYKILEAKRKNIEVKCRIFGYMDFEAEITDEEICSLLGNLWDNAIEACCKLKDEEKWIDFQMNIRVGKFVIVISNPYLEIYQDESGKLLTTKKNGGIHGIGIRTIRDITERRNGYFNYGILNHTFRMEVMICNNE